MTKKLLTAATILLSTFFMGRAQLGVQAGAMAVPGEAYPSTVNLAGERLGGMLSYTAGLFYEYRINKNLVVRPELNWLHKRWGEEHIDDVIEETLDRVMGINYLEVPLQLLYAPAADKGILLGGGPAILFGMNGKMKTKSSVGTSTSEAYKFNQTDGEKALTIGVNLLLGYRFNKIHLTLNYNRGLTNKGEHTSNAFKDYGNESHIALRVGYHFLKGGKK